ncbi:unnamed protein product [Tuber aestivum]|uniref:Choline/carnitine acyltransferase domain-containing protein n=1 Tax=Tuber aestivum TaxID=59557 RepID=A0A292Q271_9PEZI|nr:unnamed protein product [Tuber aestivum]
MPDLRPPFPHPSTNYPHPLLLLYLPSQATPFIPPSLHEQFTKALSSSHLSSIITTTAAAIPAESKNWSAEWFEEMTLEQREVVSNTIRMATLVEGEGGLGGVLSRAAAWGCRLGAEGEEEEKGGVGWQVRRFWRGFRVPGEVSDTLAGPWEDVKSPLPGVAVGNGDGDGDGDGEGHGEGNANAIVWRNGRAHTLRIIQNRKPVRESDIRRQLDHITALPAPPSKDGGANIALLSWRYGRTVWSQLHSQLLAHAQNLPAFRKLYNSALSIALDPALAWSPDEDEDGLARLLNEVRHGEHSPNRHADATFGIVSFGYGEEGRRDGKVGLVFDHTPGDCGAAIELSKILASPATQGERREMEEGVECNFIPEVLEFTFPPGPKLDIPGSVMERIPREVSTVTLNTAGRSYVSGGLVDVGISLTLLAAVAPDANGHQAWPPVYQPVYQPSFYKGRCGPGCCTTVESVAFLSSLFPSSSSSPPSPQEEDLTPAFEKYLSRRRDILSTARTASPTGIFAVHKLYLALNSAINAGEQSPDVRVVKEVLEKLRSEVQFTGFTVDKDEVVAGLSNKPSTCVVSFSATGRYIPRLPGILQRFESRWEVVAGFLDGYARVYRKVRGVEKNPRATVDK